MNINKSTLNLFNAIQVAKKSSPKSRPPVKERLLLEETIKEGFILDHNVAERADKKLLKEISDVIGISGTKANSSFHKSWQVVKDTPQEALWIQAMIHYFTTYGFEEMGIYSESSIYIPAEKLEIPGITEGIKLIVVKGLDADDLLKKILELAGSGIALSDETLKDLMAIIEENEYPSSIVKDVKNKELRAKLYDFYNLAPEEPVEYLRYVLSKVFGETLLIKNKHLFDKIVESSTDLHRKTLDNLLKQAPSDLASIFLRFKPLFLAMKKVSKNKKFFNKLRKDAEEMHKPMEEDYLNTVTARLRNGKRVVKLDLQKALENVNVFRKIRLAYALKYRTIETDSIVYKVRNGKGYATDFSFDQHKQAETALKVVLDSIGQSLKLIGQTIYIPENVNYALPATEKMFTGNFPTGSYVTVPEDMIVGIYWENQKGHRIDLDMSTLSLEGKVGWDSNYRTAMGDVMFSGDMTDASHGASELFYIKKGSESHKALYVNYFNFDEGVPVPTKLLVASEKAKNFGKNYMVDPNNILATANLVIDKQQNILGLITMVDGENRFYFAQTSVGRNISSGYDAHSGKTREYMANSMINAIDFKEVLESGGAKIVTKRPVAKEDEEPIKYLDLSPESLDKTTIINLLLGQ